MLTGHLCVRLISTLGSLFGHALLLPTKPLKSTNQVVHEQMFNDSLSGICTISSEGTWNQRLRKGLGSIPPRDNILLLEFFFSLSKASDVNIDITVNVVCL